MTAYLSKLKSLFVRAESTFNTSAFGGNPINADRLEAESITWAPTRELIERPLQLDVLGGTAGVVGGRGGTISFKVGLSGCASGGPQSVGGALALVLAASSLRRLQQTNTTATGGADAGHIVLSSATGYGAGNSGAPLLGIGYPNAGAGLQVRAIPADTAGATLAVSPAFSRTPTNGEAVYGADVWFPDPDASTAGASGSGATVTFVANGNGYQYTFTGCMAPPPKITAQSGKRVMLEFKFEVTSWTVSSLAAPSPDQFSSLAGAVVALGSPFYWKAGSSAATPIADFEFDWGLKLAPIQTTQDADGKAGFVPTSLKPVMKVKPYFAPSWDTDFSAGTEDLVLMQLGSTPGAAAAIYLPAAQIVKYPAPADIAGLVGHEVELEGHVPTAGGAWAGLSPAYVAFF
jgi:hypothetical protein